MTNQKALLLSVLVLASAVAGTLGVVSGAKADNMIEISAASAGAGVQVSVGQCPCFRWTVQVQGLGGKIETKDILISADALLQYTQSNNGNFQKLVSRQFRVGAAEALVKGAHVGVGFNGVSFGEDSSRGLSKILRTGFYALASLVQTDSVRFGLRTGYDFEKMRTLMGAEASRHIATQSANLHWESASFRGNVNAYIGAQMNRAFDSKSLRAGATANVRTRVVSFEQFELGLSAEVGVDHDPFRELFGLKPTTATGTLLMDIAWVERQMSNDD